MDGRRDCRRFWRRSPVGPAGRRGRYPIPGSPAYWHAVSAEPGVWPAPFLMYIVYLVRVECVRSVASSMSPSVCAWRRAAAARR